MVIEAQSLSKRYGDIVAVDSLSFEVGRGRCYGLVGPNGAGKTTTMKMIYCIVRPTSGTLKVFGMDVTDQPRQIKARLGVVPQENNLDPDLTTWQNLMVYARYFGLPRRLARERCLEQLQFMHLSDRADAPVPSLSGGMKRRLILSRALINNPELIILDEPTTGLDPQVRHLIWDRLLELKDRGITLLITTHYMDEAQKLCDDIIIMDEARRIDEGSPPELIRKHVPAFVLELRAGGELRRRILQQFPHLSHQDSGQNLYFYSGAAADFDGLLRAWPGVERVLRPASLEDVFMKLTGREIRA
ncbi:MAG: ABC transporter ATP-binding protein [Thermoleophilia bacterium]|jgi:lipooligosaccharide transport system ATP-binding protein